MEIERVADSAGRIEIWACERDGLRDPSSRQCRKFLGYENPIDHWHRRPEAHEAICWSTSRTLANIAIHEQELISSLPSTRGHDTLLPCDIVEAGKMRNGAKRWWCRTHQKHWGTKGDIAEACDAGELRCAHHGQRMSYVIDPPRLRIDQHTEIVLRCSLPAAFTSRGTSQPRRPRLHLHVRDAGSGEYIDDRELNAISLEYLRDSGHSAIDELTRVALTPPSALEFVLALEHSIEMGCIDCRNCGYPHWDLGAFARTAHRKHLCSNCGRDTTWSKLAIASTPLKPLHEQYSKISGCIESQKILNLDDYPAACFAVRASMPAVLWTATRAQHRGIHVRLVQEQLRIDDIFGTVIHRGKPLDRARLLEQMLAHTLG